MSDILQRLTNSFSVFIFGCLFGLSVYGFLFLLFVVISGGFLSFRKHVGKLRREILPHFNYNVFAETFNVLK